LIPEKPTVARRTAPNFLLSFLDLLCSALGGVALLVFLFAAIRKNAEHAAPPLVNGLLLIEVVDPKPMFSIGREIGLAIRDTRGNLAVLDEPDEPPATKSAVKKLPLRLNVHYRDTPSPRYRLQVQATPGEPLTMVVWLRGFDPATLTDPTRADAYAAVMQAGIPFKATWVGHDEPACEGRLAPANGFVADELPLEVPHR
jgi:hypothetical protein